MTSKKDRLRQAFNQLRVEGLVRTQKDLAEKINATAPNISRAMNGDEEYLTDSLLLRINTAFDNIFNEDWLLKGEGSMLASQDEAKLIENPNIKMIPLVSQYAQAGYLCGFADTDYMETLPRIPIIVDHEIKGHYISFEVRGDSMNDGTSNSLVEGEILICRKICSSYWKYKLHINKWYFVIVHKTEGILVKQITEHDVDKGLITLHSLNPFYEDRIISLNEVKQLFNVVQIHRKGNL